MCSKNTSLQIQTRAPSRKVLSIWVFSYEVLQTNTLFGSSSSLQPNSIFLSHHSNHQLQLQPSEQSVIDR